MREDAEGDEKEDEQRKKEAMLCFSWGLLFVLFLD